jgi:glycogen synthase
MGDREIPARVDGSATLRVLHLGFEHPRMPGAGGGSRRTHEINRRLAAAGHEITVLTTTFPGAREAVIDGVRYVPVGWGAGRNRWSRLFGYVALLPAAVRRRREVHDLVVEDFFAPFSSIAVPWWSGRPTLGVVQWLHAGLKARQYWLPFQWVERLGVRSHRRLIAVSAGTAEKLHRLNPAARVDVIGNGVEQAMFEPGPQPGRDVVFLGRLELHGKGLDLLLEAWAAVCSQVREDLVIAGGGQGEARVHRHVRGLGLGSRVRFVGWRSGVDKVTFLNEARLVVVPSRHETFGLVALEALATATPVLAFDIPSLREVLPPDVGWTVPAFDVDALASRLRTLLRDPGALAEAGARGRRFARTYDWDLLAEAQLAVYADVVEGAAVGR